MVAELLLIVKEWRRWVVKSVCDQSSGDETALVSVADEKEKRGRGRVPDEEGLQ